MDAIAWINAAPEHRWKHRIGYLLRRWPHWLVAVPPFYDLNPATRTSYTGKFVQDKLLTVGRNGEEE